MKAFYRKTIASCISLIILFLTIGPAAAAAINDTLRIRGPVYNDSDIGDILSKNGGAVTMDAGQFAAFFYNIDNNVTTETLSIKDVTEELRYYPYGEKTAGNVTT